MCVLWWAFPYAEAAVAWKLFNLGGGTGTRDNGDDEITGEKELFMGGVGD